MSIVLTNFKASIPQKRVATGTSKVSTGNINDTFNTIDALLKDEMDVLLMPYQFTHADFYNEYQRNQKWKTEKVGITIFPENQKLKYSLGLK
ncbi:MAG: hypothetical protein Q8P34_02445 [Bacteroidota bacterium]|nr:hypothetical protein [Bacteroidota bacterium]